MKISRSINSVLLGYLVFALSAVLLYQLSGIDPHSDPTTGFLVFSISYGLLFSFVGGLLTQLLSKTTKLIVNYELALILAGFAVISYIMTSGNHYSQIASIFLFAPCTLVGGWCYLKWTQRGNTIYHIVTLNDLKSSTKDNYYRPGNFEEDGFIHCTRKKSITLLVLEDYFVEISKRNVLLMLEIATAKLKAEVKYEPPAPIQGAGKNHLKDGLFFPHIYGGLNIDAIIGVGVVERVGDNFVWPSSFKNINKYF